MSDTEVVDSPVGTDSDSTPKASRIPPGNRLKKSVGVPARKRARDAKYQNNVKRRGDVPVTYKKKKEGYTVGPVMLGFFLFVVVGSSVFQVIRFISSAAVP